MPFTASFPPRRRRRDFNGGFELVPPFVSATRGNNVWIDGSSGGSTGSNRYGWSAYTGFTTGDAQFDTTEKNSGTASLHIRVLGTGEFIEIHNNLSGLAGKIAVQPSTAYKGVYWMKTNVVSGDSADGAYLNFLSFDAANGAVNNNNTTKVKTTTGWTQYTVNFTTNSNAVYIDVIPLIYGHTGAATLIMDAWFDDISLKRA